MGVDPVIPAHRIYPCIPSLFACPELAKVAFFDAAIMLYYYVIRGPRCAHLRYLYCSYLPPVTDDYFAASSIASSPLVFPAHSGPEFQAS